MVHIYNPDTIVKVVPKDGEIEVKLDITININADGLVSMTSAEQKPKKEIDDDDKVDFIVPDFTSGTTLSFGKEKK